MHSSFHHPQLGQFDWDPSVNSWEARVELLSGCTISFSIVAEGIWEGVDPERICETAMNFLAKAREHEPHCRQRVADDLLDIYNTSWADDDPEEGMPPHSRTEFLAAISPSAISLYHDLSSSWSYECGDLFAGHDVWFMLDEKFRFMGKASLG